MSDWWWPARGNEKIYYPDFVYEDKNSSLFHIGQCYEAEPARVLRCKTCDSSQFRVGQGSYYTAIKCPTCGWEMCIHDG